jgi:hypothetical protein
VFARAIRRLADAPVRLSPSQAIAKGVESLVASAKPLPERAPAKMAAGTPAE